MNTRVQLEPFHSTFRCSDILVCVMVCPSAITAITGHLDASESSRHLRTSSSRICVGVLPEYALDHASLEEDLAQIFVPHIIAGVNFLTRRMVVHPDLEYNNFPATSILETGCFAFRAEAMDGKLRTTNCRARNDVAPKVIRTDQSSSTISNGLLCNSFFLQDEAHLRGLTRRGTIRPPPLNPLREPNRIHPHVSTAPATIPEIMRHTRLTIDLPHSYPGRVDFGRALSSLVSFTAAPLD
ncbi:unnamed protein product [Mycena citricolor]|uniref:Uncharacterized protein n=1 Tax=Mycena citricolor TaxID=2018698 RepID=A0AAD2JZW4_9AGAR|nr:unnamed protein product [Mycena citricolor]